MRDTNLTNDKPIMSNSKISMFGVSASGKTCFLYAMSQVMSRGVRQDNNLVQIISNRARQQMKLNAGYMKLAQRQWPQTSDKTESYDFKVSMQCNGYFSEIIDSLEIQDYRGGLLQSTQELDEEEFDNLMKSFRGSSAIIFIVDGQTLINALEPQERDISHANNTDVLEQFSAQSQIRFVENIFMEYKRVEEEVPPILIAISKGDVFASDYEQRNAMNLIKEYLPSIFAIGSQLTVGITTMSLGDNLGSDAEGGLIGQLKLSPDYNIHIPVIFGIYADLCYQYEEMTDENERKGLAAVLSALRSIFSKRVQLFINGRQAREA